MFNNKVDYKPVYFVFTKHAIGLQILFDLKHIFAKTPEKKGRFRQNALLLLK